MRKATLGLLVVLCLWGATSWQRQQTLPQWRVVAERHMTNSTEFLFNVTVFTFQETGLYRLSGFCSAVTNYNQAGWEFFLTWRDISGNSVTANVQCGADTNGPTSIVTVFDPQASSPVVLRNEFTGDGSATYDAAITIEKLQ
jgi:hypothetical protein